MATSEDQSDYSRSRRSLSAIRSPSHSASFSDSQIESTSGRHFLTASTVTPVDAARIRVLLVPIGQVRQGQLQHWVDAIAQFSLVPITDLLPHVDAVLASNYDASAGAGMTTVEGMLRFHFTSTIGEEHEYLEGLQTYRQILGVIGIVDCEMCDDMQAAYDEFIHELSRHTTAVAYRCLAFDPQPDQLDNVPDVTVIPNAGGSLLFYLQTLLSDFAGSMVSALSLMAGSIEGRADLESPAQSRFSFQSRGTAALGRDGLSPTGSAFSEGRANRNSMSESQAAAAAATAARATIGRRSAAGGSARRQSMPSTPSDEQTQNSATGSPGGYSGRGRHGGEIDREVVAPQISQIEQTISSPATQAMSPRDKWMRNNSSSALGSGDSASAGRLKKLQGDLYLMSGRLAEAFASYTASIHASRKFNDHLWQAVAMEGYCAALLLLCGRCSERHNVGAFLAGIPKTTLSDALPLISSLRASKPTAPQLAHRSTQPANAVAGGTAAVAAAVSKPSSTNAHENSPEEARASDDGAGLADLLDRIGTVFSQVPQLYEKCYSFAPLLHAEACIREALVLHTIRDAYLHSSELALESMLQINSLRPLQSASVSHTTRDVVSNARNIPLRSAINEWLQRGWASSFTSLALTDQLEMASEVSSLFGDLGYSRKSVFFLRQFLLLAIPILLRTSAGLQAERGVSRGGSAVGSPTRPSMSSRGDPAASSAFTDGSSAFSAVLAAAAAATSNSQAMAHLLCLPILPQPPSGTPSHLHTSFEAFGASTTLAITRERFTKAGVGLRQAVIACLDMLVYSFETGSRHCVAAKNMGRRTFQQPRTSSSQSKHGWLHLQADIMRECLAIAEALPSYPHAIAAAFRLVGCLNSLSTIVSEARRRALLDEQHMLRNYLQRTIALFHQRYHFDPVYLARASDDSLPRPLCSAEPRVVGRDALVVAGALDSLLVGIQLCTFPGDQTPIPSEQSTAVDASSTHPLFLHNPSAQIQGELPPPLAAHETVCFVATLTNLFPFALVLTELCLVGEVAASGDSDSSTGTLNFNAERTQCTVPANSRGQVLLRATPGVPGRLRVAGVKATLFQHLLVTCLLGEESEVDASQRLKERPLQQRLDAERNSMLDLDKKHTNDTKSARLTAMNSGYSLSTSVVPSLPKLSVLKCSPANGESLSLLEGEFQVVALTIVNSSEYTSVDRFEVVFEPLASAGKVDKESRADSQLCDLTSAAFSYLSTPTPPRIEPGGEQCLKIRVAGICDLCGGEVVVRYGNTRVSGWSRELRWPVRVSVSRFLVPAHEPSNSDFGARYLELPPFIARALSTDYGRGGRSNTAISDSDEMTRALEEAMAALKEKEFSTSELPLQAQDLFCLAEVDIENIDSTDVTLDIEVDLSSTAASEAADLYARHMRLLSPLVHGLSMRLLGRRSVSRIVVPLPRVRLSEQLLATPIPGAEADGGPDTSVFYPWRTTFTSSSLSSELWVSGSNRASQDRQFVVSKAAQLSDQDMALRRAAFWYQYDTASRVRIRWTSEHSGRQGYIDPRHLFSIDERSLAVLRPERLSVGALVNNAPATFQGNGVLQAWCAMRRPASIEFLLANRSSSELSALLDVQLICDAGDMTEVSQLEHSDDVNAESGADIDMSFVPALLTATSDGIFSSEELCSDGCEFQFVLADDHADLGFVAAQAALEPGGNTTPLSEDEQEDAYLASLYRRGVVFDNVNQLQLPAIAPGSVYRLELPLYILHSGMYEISYAVHDSSACLPLDDKKTAVLAQGTLNIESSIGFTDGRSSDS